MLELLKLEKNNVTVFCHKKEKDTRERENLFGLMIKASG